MQTHQILQRRSGRKLSIAVRLDWDKYYMTHTCRHTKFRKEKVVENYLELLDWTGTNTTRHLTLMGLFQDRFDKVPSSIQATYMFVLPFPVPLHVWYKVMSCVTSFHWPLHMWRRGLVVQHGVAELLIICEGQMLCFVLVWIG